MVLGNTSNELLCTYTLLFASMLFNVFMMLVVCNVEFTGLMQSKKTSVMTTPKHLGAHIWQICLADLSPTNQAYIPWLPLHQLGRSTPLLDASHGTEWQFNPYHADGYSWLVSTSTKHEYSHNCSKCSSMPSGTIVLYWVFGSKIDSRRCYPLFIILYIFLRWGHSFLVYIVPILCHTAKKMKTMKLS